MPILLNIDDIIAWVVIDREGKGNSLDYEHAIELARAIRRSCEMEEPVLVAIRGSGNRFFSTGLDLEALAGIGDAMESWRLAYEGFGGIFKSILDCGKPVVAAVNGHAVGIGFEIVNVADLAWAVKTARLGVPAARWGLVAPDTPVAGPLLFNPKHAALLTLTGKLITAEEAYRMGFINGVVENTEALVSMVREAALQIKEKDPWAITQTLRLLRAPRKAHLTELGLTSLAFSSTRSESRNRAREYLSRRRAR